MGVYSSKREHIGERWAKSGDFQELQKIKAILRVF